MIEPQDMECWNITIHKVSEGQFHCWFESDDNLSGEVENIEADFFAKHRESNYNILDNLPIEGEYTHDPIKIGQIKHPANGSTPEFDLDLERGYSQLEEYGYCRRIQ